MSGPDDDNGFVDLPWDHDSEVAFALYIGIAVGIAIGAGLVLLLTWLL